MSDLVLTLRKRAALYRELFNEKDGIESARWPAKPFTIDAELFEQAADALDAAASRLHTDCQRLGCRWCPTEDR